MHSAFSNEEERLSALRSLDLLDTRPTEAFDRITKLAAQIFSVPIALISLVDEQRQWFMSRVGLAAPETCREDAFCDYTIQSPAVLVVPDAVRDPRFKNNPLVTGDPRIRFYAGAPLILNSRHVLGSLCLIDTVPRDFDLKQQNALQALASTVVAQIELQRSVGRIDDSTHLPNKAQLSLDLVNLCEIDPGVDCVLVVLDLLEHNTRLNVIRASGTMPIEHLVSEAGRRLKKWLNGASPVYHIGLTRLAIVLRHAREKNLQRFLNALLAELKHPATSSHDFLLQQQPIVGAVGFPLVKQKAEDALRCATAALYNGEANSGDINWYNKEEDNRHQRNYQLLRAVPQAMAHGEFTLVYQPQLDRQSLGFRCAEALLRWTHPALGNIPPGDFIPLVENTALIHPVTEWVLHTALAQLANWERQGLTINVAINISAKNLEDTEFIRKLQNACAVHEINPDRLQLECTENIALTGSSTRRTINQARAIGIQIALDDFGTGYCNFGSLYSLPAEVLKLDQSLIRPIEQDERARDIVQSMIDLGHSLGYRLLAEGVETAAVFDLLIGMGCDEIQGFYVSRPLSANDAFLRMKEQNDVFLAPPL